jgi:hypothetical protein
MLGALEVPGRLTAEPPEWFKLTGVAHELLGAAAAISTPSGGRLSAVALAN